MRPPTGLGLYPELALRFDRLADDPSGIPLLILRTDTDTHVGGARIVESDVAAENGYVHTIENVLFPE